jgi:hypothetical protein
LTPPEVKGQVKNNLPVPFIISTVGGDQDNADHKTDAEGDQEHWSRTHQLTPHFDRS